MTEIFLKIIHGTRQEIWGHMPEAVVRPGNTTQVSAVMKIASRYRIPVTPRGPEALQRWSRAAGRGIVLSLKG